MPLPWFRRKKPAEQAPFAAASEHLEVESLTVDEPAAQDAAGGDGQSTTSPNKRRRGTRGGRNRKKKPADGTTVNSALAAAEKPAARERKTPERKPRERPAQSRRRTPPKRAPLPKAKRELLISVDAGEKRVAVLEDDKVAEVYLERPERHSTRRTASCTSTRSSAPSSRVARAPGRSRI